MPQVTAEQRINCSKRLVWNKIAGFSDTADANPYVYKSYPANDQTTGKGAIRHCELNADGSEYSQEQIVDWVDGESYQIQMVGGTNPPPVDNLVIELSVLAINSQASYLRMSFDYQPRWGIIGNIMNRLIIRRMLNKVAHNVLTGYRVHIETDQKIQSMEMMQTLVTNNIIKFFVGAVRAGVDTSDYCPYL